MTIDRTNLYAVLGLTSHATQEQVRHAYRALLRKHHPDTRDLGDPVQATNADAALQHVIAAYAVLGDPDRRAAYDQTLEPRRTTAPDPARRPLRTPGADSHQSPIQAGPVRWHRWP